MPTARDPRYRGRHKRPASQRPAGHLRTNYNETDFEAFRRDLERLYASWPKAVREKDKKAADIKYLTETAQSSLIVMVPLTVILVWAVIKAGMPFYWLPIAQSLVLVYFFLLHIIGKSNNNDWYTQQYIYREAERRGIETKNRYDAFNIYYLMNKINADYNSRLWNRKFTWT